MRKILLLMGLFSTIFACKVKKEINNIYPYIITDDYPKEQTIIVDTLGYGLYVALVYDKKGVVTNVTPAELEESGMTINELKDSAIANLVKAAKSQQIRMTLFKTNDSIPFVLFSDSWLSASCILLPELEEKFRPHLGTQSLYACLPHRDAMLVFPQLDEEQKIKTRAFVKEKESDGDKPLSFGFFEINNHHITAID